MKPSFRALLIAAATLAACGASQAQTVYRIVGPDGKVTFSDKPPANAEQGKVAATGIGASGAASLSALPYELRQVASRYPVTLYTSSDCSPCNSGRSLLTARGIPFSERTINRTTEDQAALTRIGGDDSLPLLTIGQQKLRGFSSGEWDQYLDVAGYPKTSALPANYRNPAPSPLVSAQAPAAKPAETAPTVSTPPAPQGPTPSNPAGIQF